MNFSFDSTTIVLFLLAVFVIYRLRSVLGQRHDDDVPSFRRETPRDNVVPLPVNPAAQEKPEDAIPAEDRWKGIAEAGSPLALALDEVSRANGGFDPRNFLQGARAAYEMIVLAFAKGDRKTLRDLLSKEVFDGFAAALSERDSRGETVETNFVSIDKAEITDAALKGREAQLTIRFVSKIITATRDRAGQVIDGAPDKIADVTDIWTFARDTGTRDPNWRLVATEAGA